jgi:hypothetical protein
VTIGRPRKYTDDELLAALREFYRLTGRAPRRRDTGGDSIVPHFSVYADWFGSLGKAIKLANVPQNRRGIPIEPRREKPSRPAVVAPSGAQAPPPLDPRTYWLTKDPSVKSTSWVHPYARERSA